MAFNLKHNVPIQIKQEKWTLDRKGIGISLKYVNVHFILILSRNSPNPLFTVSLTYFNFTSNLESSIQTTQCICS